MGKNRITVQKVAAVGVIGLAYMATYCFSSFVCRRRLPIHVKLIISGIGGTVIGATGGVAARNLWEHDGSAEIIKEVISAIQ